MISLSITSYPQTEKEIEEKATKQPWFLDYHKCRNKLVSHRKESVKCP